MKIVAKKDRKLLLINTGNTQNENKAETIELTVPEEYEDYNKKIVFVTDDGIVWDIIQDNTYKLTKAITKYKQVNFYIWLTKGDVDFRSKTMPLRFYYNEDASDEITDEEISGVNTVVNILEEEITKVDSLETELRALITDIQNKLDNGEFDGEDGYTPQKGVDYFTQQDIEEMETDVKEDVLDEVYTKSEADTLLEGKADIEDIPDVSSFITKDVNNLTNYTLKTNTGSLIDLEINDTTYVVTLKLKSQDGTVISTDTIDLPLESVVVSGRYDNTTKKVILTLENGSEVDFSVADLVAGLQTEITSQNKLASDLVDDTNSGNKFVTTTEKQTWNNKLDESDLTDYVKNTDYATSSKGGVIKATNGAGIYVSSSGALYANERTYSQYQGDSLNEFMSKGTFENALIGKQLINQTQLEESQETQDEQIAKLKATLPTTTGEGQDITLNKTAELEFKKPPLPMGNSEQESTTGKNLLPNNITSQNINGLQVTKNSDGTLLINGTATSQTSLRIATNLTLNSGTYYLSGNIGGGSTTYRLYAPDFPAYDDGAGKQFTLNSQTSSNVILLIFNNTTMSNVLIKPMIEQSSTATSYEPYTNGASPNPDYPQEITNVTGDVEVKVQNKNLWNGELEQNAWNNSDGTTTVWSNQYIRSKSFIEVKSNTTYTLNYSMLNNEVKNGNILLYDKDKNFINSLQTPNNLTFTTSATTKYLKFNFYAGAGASVEGMSNLQLEKSSTSTPYTPHQEQVLPLTLGNIELCKIGDYQDYFYKNNGKWYKYNAINKLVLNGSENWSVHGSIASWFYWDGITNGFTNNTIRGYALSNYFTQKAYSTVTSLKNGEFAYGQVAGETRKRFVIKDTDYTTVADFKTWLSTHNTIVYYVLATPTDTEITDTTLISQLEEILKTLSYQGQTNITSNTIALFSVEAYQSTKLVLEEMATAIVALGGV